MPSHSERPHNLSSDLSLSVLCATPTWTHALQDTTRTITPTCQKKRVAQCESYRPTISVTTIDILTDDVLLEIFDLVRGSTTDSKFPYLPVWKWHRLVHVCYKWRQIILASPLRLDLHLLCTYGTPVRKNLGFWPAFPILVDYNRWKDFAPNGEDNVVAALEHPGRVRQIRLTGTSSLWRKIMMAAVMQEPFPALTYLSMYFSMDSINVPVLPGGFLGGSAPCLREIRFIGIPIPGPALSTLLSSTSDLVELVLDDIPEAGYISPAVLVACLAVLPKLEELEIRFQTQRPHIDRNPIHDLPPEARVVLPALTSFLFEGECAYLEDMLARIDTPGLTSIDIAYCNLDDSSVPQLSDFINRTDLKLPPSRDAEIYFYDRDTGMIAFRFRHGVDLDDIAFEIRFSSSERIDEQVWHMAQVLHQTSAMLSNVDGLAIKAEQDWELESDERMDIIEWLELFLPFTAVETLCVSKQFTESVAHAFEQITAEMVTQVLPNLGLLCLEGQPARIARDLFILFRTCGRLLRVTIIGDGEINSEGSNSEIDPNNLSALF